MRAIRPMNLLLALFFLALSGCQQHTDDINMVVLKGTLEARPATAATTVAHRNKRYKSVPIDQSSGNPMRDALEALFSDDDLEKYYSSLLLASSYKEAGKSIYHFRGKAKADVDLSLAGFTKDFIITISRNKIGLNYSIEFIEN